jgi:tetratricopeptide (TPR) repeat protein
LCNEDGVNYGQGDGERGTMVDFAAQRPSPAASGTLAKTPLLHLLVYAHEKKLGGTIDIVSPDERVASLLFVAGEPAKAHLSEPVSYLGQVLVELGFMTVEVLDRTLAELEEAGVAGSRPLCGEFLRTRALVDPAGVEAAFREQLARRLRYVAMMPPETTYAFYDGFDALKGIGVDSPRGVDPLPMLWTLLSERAPQAHVDAALARVVSSPLRIAKTADLARLDLAASEQAAIELLRIRPLTVAEFSRISGLAERDARLLSYLLLMTKQVDLVPPSRSSRPPRPSSSRRIPVPARATVPPTPVPPARSVAPPSPVSAGDGTTSRPPPRLAPELSERWRAIVDRARTIERADYFAMLDLARDSTPEQARSSFLALAMKWHPDRLPPELFPVREACSRVFGRLSEAHATLTDPEKRAGYMRLLADGSGSPEMQETIAKVVAATEDFKKAEAFFRRNDFLRAEDLCRRALAGDATQADYHAMLAWLVSLKPENQSPEKVMRSIRMLDKAIAMSEQCERAFFWRGMLYKRLGRPEAAYRDFHEAVELNPDNIDAVREMRLHNMRSGTRSRPSVPAVQTRSSPARSQSAKQEEKPSLLSRFFKKG